MLSTPQNTTSTGPVVPSRELAFSDLYGVLMSIVTPHGILASKGNLFRAVFGRDSLRVALDLLPWHPELSERVIVSLAKLQGVTIDTTREEEPGRIHHEYRSLYLDGTRMNKDQYALMERLAGQWGWLTDKESMCYYGSVDATAQYVRLVALHVSRYGPDILDRTVLHPRGGERTIRDALLHSLRWLEQRVTASPLGLVEFMRVNPNGIRWQVLRDGTVSYLHEDGSLVNDKAPVAPIEVQGLTYDAFTMSAELLGHVVPERADLWRRMAAHIQAQVFEHFWLPETASFAMGLDRGTDGKLRPIRTKTSVPTELLDTGIFDTLDRHDRERYVAAIVHDMYSPEFLTSVGIRCRALAHKDILPYWDYQGTFTSWPVLSNIFALGLRRQGLIGHAFDMENRLINAVNVAGALPEFFYVDEGGTVRYNARVRQETDTPGDREGTIEEAIRATNAPEQLQAWTVSAVLRAKLARRDARRGFPDERTPFETKLTRKTGLRRVQAKLLRGDKLREIYPPFDTVVDQAAGFAAEQKHVEHVYADKHAA